MSTEIPRFDHEVARAAAQTAGRAAFSPWRMLAYLVLGVVAVIYIIPFYWMIASAIKPQSEMFKFPPTLIPRTVTLDNFLRVFEVIPLGRAYWNTFYTTLYIVLSQLLFCSVAGYIFEKGRFRFRELCFTLILITMIIPFQSEMVPLFLLMSDLGLVDTHAAIVLPAMITPFAVFFFRQNVKSIPDDLLDAARIDGTTGTWWCRTSSRPSHHYHIRLPGGLEQLPVAADHSDSRRKMLIEQVLSVLTAEFAQEPAARIAATMAVVPILLVFFFSQRYFVRGIALTGLK